VTIEINEVFNHWVELSNFLLKNDFEFLNEFDLFLECFNKTESYIKIMDEEIFIKWKVSVKPM